MLYVARLVEQTKKDAKGSMRVGPASLARLDSEAK
jgi:hypothetical protein